MSKQPERPTCATCPYLGQRRQNDPSHTCHRRAPVAIVMSLQEHPASIDGEANFWPSETAWPAVDSHDYCGDHPDFPAWIKATRGRSKSN